MPQAHLGQITLTQRLPPRLQDARIWRMILSPYKKEPEPPGGRATTSVLKSMTSIMFASR